ncbi:oxysterol-binding protein-related protein 8 [Lingula anatina]|uniref:Oxysterol-binding protein n=1 Tax=Lingula anatina TaxID=7574 RepID=A0A1S3JCR4_LINAN|nr:oxysterol-binding protein-related protein 8 [Lingula anatina]|eukprot:XP_013408205.1 oxysterol-binding protein-related protein 8 [Lingula anatina]
MGALCQVHVDYITCKTGRRPLCACKFNAQYKEATLAKAVIQEFDDDYDYEDPFFEEGIDESYSMSRSLVDTTSSTNSSSSPGQLSSSVTMRDSSGHRLSPVLSDSKEPYREGKSFSFSGSVGVASSGESPSQSPTIAVIDEDQNYGSDTAPRSPAFQGQRSKSEGKLQSFHPAVGKFPKSRESLKVQKKNYRKEKKRATKELLHTLKDPTVIVMADWLKIRGTLKGWTKLWCVLKPGLLILYKSPKQKSKHWVGTILLNTTELIERPSKKDGFCFKLFHPLDQSIWAPRGPKGETIGAITQPLPYSYLIFRALSESAGKCWMDALELALRCSSLLIRSMTKDKESANASLASNISQESFLTAASQNFNIGENMNESDCEKHFLEFDLEDHEDKTDKEDRDKSEFEKSEDSSCSESDEDEVDTINDDLQPMETPYVENIEDEQNVAYQQGDGVQTSEVADENKSIIWALVKQVRPGMDLSKVVLPTFILEPRSLLERYADFYYHADILSGAVLQEDPYSRMKSVVKWYVSGFYKKPKGAKKPYNPILGETFRCCWKHPKTDSRTFYIAEQISHHPPMTGFCVINRKDGFSINGCVLAKSKFYGNSLSAIMDGGGRLTFLKRGEDYLITMPYAHCKGVLIGTLTMELGGKVRIECEKTGYKTELEFKLKPFLGSPEQCNRIIGKIRFGEETLATVHGHWDQEIYITDKSTGETEVFWGVTSDVRAGRLKRFTVPLEHQEEFESVRLWQHVTAALLRSDQEMATHEKFILEDAQRKAAKERKALSVEWVPRLFERDPLTNDWVYKYLDSRPWDPINDVIQYEKDYMVMTKTRRKVPIVRTTSILSVNNKPDKNSRRQKAVEHSRAVARIKRNAHMRECRESGSSTPDPEHRIDESTSESEVEAKGKSNQSVDPEMLKQLLNPLQEMQRQNNQALANLHGHLQQVERAYLDGYGGVYLQSRDWVILGAILLFQTILYWFFK